MYSYPLQTRLHNYDETVMFLCTSSNSSFYLCTHIRLSRNELDFNAIERDFNNLLDNSVAKHKLAIQPKKTHSKNYKFVSSGSSMSLSATTTATPSTQTDNQVTQIGTNEKYVKLFVDIFCCFIVSEAYAIRSCCQLW